ncbi:MAG: endonuclease III [Clostridia bacterium]|nr:endonuclease III [Clostridia bacterium]
MRPSKREKCERLERVDVLLRERYPEAECALEYGGDAWRLLVMGRLSAQCTDAKVNAVCKELFTKYPTFAEMAEANVEEVEQIIKPCGLYKMKAKNLVDASVMLRDEYHGELPSTMEELLRFPGVGRKIANLLLGDIFHTGGVVADTHCIRICGRLGFYPEREKDPYKVEMTMGELFEKTGLCASDFCHRIVWFGREVCIARSPKCAVCEMRDFCKGRRDE